MSSGIFGKLFDLDRDGKLNAMERAMDFMLFEEMTREDEREDEIEDEGLDSEDYDF